LAELRKVYKGLPKDKFFFDEMRTIKFSRNDKGEIGRLITKILGGIDVWGKTTKPIPSRHLFKKKFIF
jgi:hypothetical protein